MATITEDYASLETAKFLKEKGFECNYTMFAKLTKDFLLVDSIQEMDRIINNTRLILNIKNLI